LGRSRGLDLALPEPSARAAFLAIVKAGRLFKGADLEARFSLARD
jgi:hypothetical protein